MQEWEVLRKKHDQGKAKVESIINIRYKNAEISDSGKQKKAQELIEKAKGIGILVYPPKPISKMNKQEIDLFMRGLRNLIGRKNQDILLEKKY